MEWKISKKVSCEWLDFADLNYRPKGKFMWTLKLLTDGKGDVRVQDGSRRCISNRQGERILVSANAIATAWEIWIAEQFSPWVKVNREYWKEKRAQIEFSMDLSQHLTARGGRSHLTRSRSSSLTGYGRSPKWRQMMPISRWQEKSKQPTTKFDLNAVCFRGIFRPIGRSFGNWDPPPIRTKKRDRSLPLKDVSIEMMIVTALFRSDSSIGSLRNSNFRWSARFLRFIKKFRPRKNRNGWTNDVRSRRSI
jgi:hypothetical protein